MGDDANFDVIPKCEVKDVASYVDVNDPVQDRSKTPRTTKAIASRSKLHYTLSYKAGDSPVQSWTSLVLPMIHEPCREIKFALLITYNRVPNIVRLKCHTLFIPSGGIASPLK